MPRSVGCAVAVPTLGGALHGRSRRASCLKQQPDAARASAQVEATADYNIATREFTLNTAAGGAAKNWISSGLVADKVNPNLAPRQMRVMQAGRCVA